MSRILVIDDDVHIGNILEELLTREGHTVLRAYSGTEAVLTLDAARPDLVLLDLMLPGLTGDRVLPKIQGIPVIVLSAKTDIDSKVSLLRSGAADYVTKPFDSRELMARVAAALRKTAPNGCAPLTWGPIRLDPAVRRASVEGTDVRLTRTEYAILHLLMQTPSQVVTKSLLLERVSADTPDCTESSLKTHVSNLRKKLRDAGAGDPIEAVWGIGFKLKEKQTS